MYFWVSMSIVIVGHFLRRVHATTSQKMTTKHNNLLLNRTARTIATACARLLLGTSTVDRGKLQQGRKIVSDLWQLQNCLSVCLLDSFLRCFCTWPLLGFMLALCIDFHLGLLDLRTIDVGAMLAAGTGFWGCPLPSHFSALSSSESVREPYGC